jgi:hypothetical protein
MKRVLLFSLIGVCSLTLAACGSSNESTTKKTSSTVSAKKETEEKGTYENRTLTTPEGVLKITDIVKGTDYDGKPLIYVLFDLTNNSGEAKNVQSMVMGFMSASQNTGSTTEKLDYGIAMDSPYQEQLDMLQKDINEGATIQAAYTYELADETKPVIFTFTDKLFSFSDSIATEEITIQ